MSLADDVTRRRVLAALAEHPGTSLTTAALARRADRGNAEVRRLLFQLEEEGLVWSTVVAYERPVQASPFRVWRAASR